MNENTTKPAGTQERTEPHPDNDGYVQVRCAGCHRRYVEIDVYSLGEEALSQDWFCSPGCAQGASR